MNSPHMPGDRFFARVRNFDMECPSCGTVYMVSHLRRVPHHTRTKTRRMLSARVERAQRRQGKGITPKLSMAWNDVLQRFRCHVCAAAYGLGIVAWPIRHGTRLQPAEDSVPTKRQALAIRAQSSGGFLVRTKTGSDDPRNIRVTEPCCCDPDTRFSHPACPIHGELKGHLPAAPQRTWGGSLPQKPRKISDYDDE